MNKFQELMESIDILISRRLRYVTSVNYGIIKQINSNNCVITIKGEDYTLPFYGNTPVLNRKYPVILPQGNLSQAFIIG